MIREPLLRCQLDHQQPGSLQKRCFLRGLTVATTKGRERSLQDVLRAHSIWEHELVDRAALGAQQIESLWKVQIYRAIVGSSLLLLPPIPIPMLILFLILILDLNLIPAFENLRF